MSNSKTPTPAELNPLVALYNARRYAELEGQASKMVKRYPASGFAWKLLGAAQQMQGKNALEALQKTADLMPDDAKAHSKLGVVQNSLSLFNEAVSSFQKSLSIEPNSAITLNNLGTSLRHLGKLDEALIIYRRALKLQPDSAHILFNLGTTLKDLDQLDIAMENYRRVITLKPDSAEAHCNLGGVLCSLGQFDEALSACQQALKINPRLAEAYSNMGSIFKGLGRYKAALESYHHAISAGLNSAKDYRIMAGICEKLGRIDESIVNFRRSFEMEPELSTYSDLLFVLNYSTSRTPSECLSEAQNFGQMASAKVERPYSTWQCENQPDRLRVGMVSGDFRYHSVGQFLVGLLPHIDPDKIELIAYPTYSQEDEVTKRLRPSFSKWRPLYEKSDEDAARLIHDDGIHVLMDISGHTGHNRLPVFAWKPAPVQVAWLGLPNTTGMSEIDYLLGDALATPEEIASHFSETIWRMPESYLCFSAPVNAIDIVPLPALSAGHITFGSFNNLTKMNDEVVELWSRILLSVPDSRLYLKNRQLDSAETCETTRARFAKHGITPERLLLKGRTSSTPEHLAEYNKVDIALDPFPYPGATTSIEALWMGVPVLTLHGDRFVSLISKTVAHYAGLPDWVATDKNDCVAKAVSFTADLDQLASLRAGLREQVLASSLFDAPRFTKNLAEALWGMWQAHMTS